MFPVRKGTPVQCYKDGEKIGEKTTQEWAKELGIRPQSVYDSKFKGTLVQGHYRFYTVGVDPDESPKPVTLSEKAAEAKAQGKTYAQMQMEETLAKLKEDKMENETPIDKAKPCEIAEDTKKDILLSDFAKLADETTIIVYMGEQWILTAPSDSPIFEPLAWFIDSFRAEYMDGAPCMKVTVWS